MALLTFPVELLRPIIAYAFPDDFESFALTCKFIHSACFPFIAKHNFLKQRYRHFHFVRSDEDENEDCSSSLQLLARIAEERLIAQYITFADLKNDRPPVERDVGQERIDRMKESGKLLALLQNSPYLEAAGLDASQVMEHMYNRYVSMDDCSILNEGEELAATLLLTLLPNTTHLAMDKEWPVYHARNTNIGRSALLDEIVERANDPRDYTAGLSKISDILPSTAWGYENRHALAIFSPLLSIKSVKSFKAGGCIALDDNYTGKAFPLPPYETFGYGLEEVDLVGACVNADELRKFLSRTKRLKKFRLSYETKWHGCGHDWDAGATMAMIEEEVADTLEALSFSIITCFGSIETSIAPFMKKFKQLKELELDIRTLLPEESHITKGKKFDKFAIPPLRDMLPATIEKLRLLVTNINDPKQSDALSFLFQDFSKDQEENFPNLEEIVIRRLWTEEIAKQRHQRDWTFTSHTQTLQEELEEDSRNERVSSNTRSKDSSSLASKQADKKDWKTDLRELRPGINVSFVKAKGCENVVGNVLPEFLPDWCARYEVYCIA